MKFILSLIGFLSLYSTASAVELRSAYRSNLCMDVNRGEMSSWRYERNVEAWDCNGNSNQQFGLQLHSVSGNNAIFTIQALGKCLDIDLGYTEDWTRNNNVQLWGCNSGSNQQFRLEPRGSGWYQIRSIYDGRCLDIDLNQYNGWRYQHNVQLWTCTGESNQLWQFTAGGVVLPVE